MSNPDQAGGHENRAANSAARFGLAVGLAGTTAVIGWCALVIELVWSLDRSFEKGRSVAEALFFFFRYFTILTNVGVAGLMSVTTLCLVTHRRLPPSRVYNAALIYILVTCATYEIMLRHQWRPQGLQFVTDTVIHDIVPLLTLAFWLGFAPRSGARWRDVAWMLVYPAAYLTMTLAAGIFGEGYPYSFLNVDKLGLPSVLVVAAVFLAIFYALGLATTGISMARPRR